MAQKSSDRSSWWLPIVAVLGAIGGALITGAFNYLDHQRDLDAKMIELSIGILRAPPSAETKALRFWAVDVMKERAKMRIISTPEVKRDLLGNAWDSLIEHELPFVDRFVTDSVTPYYDYEKKAPKGSPQPGK